MSWKKLLHGLTVRKNSGSNIGSRPRLNFIEGDNIVLSVVDDAVDNEIDVSITSDGNVIGPATHAAGYVPQWNETPNSKTLLEGCLITAAGAALIDDASAAIQRTTLGLGSVATRTVRDTLMVDDETVPDGEAIIAYGDANWGSSGGLWTDYPASNYIKPDNQPNLRIADSNAKEWDLYIDKTTISGSPFINKAVQFNLTNAQSSKLGWTIYTEIDTSSTHSDGSVAIYAKAITQSGAGWTAAVHGEVHDRMSSDTAIAGNFEMWNKNSNVSNAYGVVSGINAWSGNPGSYYNAQAAFLVNSATQKQWKHGLQFNQNSCLDYEIKAAVQLRIDTGNGTQNVIFHSANIMKKTGTSCTVGTIANFFNCGYFTAMYLFNAAGVVSMGLPNTGGGGFRLLRVPNVT